MRLTDYCDKVYCLERNVSENTAYLLMLSCRMLDEWKATPVEVGELCDDLVSRWVRDLERSERFAPRTIAGRRGDVLCVWRYAYHRGDCDKQPVRVRNVRVPQPIPSAWTVEELGRIVAACKQLIGHLGNGVPRRLYFPTLLTFVYETGVRRSDAWRFSLDMLREDGSVVFVQNKTSMGHVARIRESTAESLKGIASLLKAMEDKRWQEPLRWPHTPRMVYEWIDKAKEIAGVTSDGALQQLRRTGATHVERIEHGAGSRYLGHQTPGLAQRHYIDVRLAYPNRPLPPDFQ